MLAHRLRLWANNKSPLVQDLVFSGLHAIFLWTEGVNPIRPGAPGQWESGRVGPLRSGGSRFGDLSGQDPTQQTKDADPALVYCWANVCDDVPTLRQNWLNVSWSGSQTCFPCI